MQTIMTCFWRQIAGRLAIYRSVRRVTAKRVLPRLQPELLNDHLLRDLGLPARHADARHPRL